MAVGWGRGGRWSGRDGVTPPLGRTAEPPVQSPARWESAQMRPRRPITALRPVSAGPQCAERPRLLPCPPPCPPPPFAALALAFPPPEPRSPGRRPDEIIAVAAPAPPRRSLPGGFCEEDAESARPARPMRGSARAVKFIHPLPPFLYPLCSRSHHLRHIRRYSRQTS